MSNTDDVLGDIRDALGGILEALEPIGKHYTRVLNASPCRNQFTEHNYRVQQVRHPIPLKPPIDVLVCTRCGDVKDTP